MRIRGCTAGLVQQKFIERAADIGYPYTKAVLRRDTRDTALTAAHFFQRRFAPLIAICIDIGDVLASNR